MGMGLKQKPGVGKGLKQKTGVGKGLKWKCCTLNSLQTNSKKLLRHIFYVCGTYEVLLGYIKMECRVFVVEYQLFLCHI